MREPAVQWITPAPLWDKAMEHAPDKTRFRQPALLRFATDSFVEDLMTLLRDDSDGMQMLVARKETWRSPAVGWQTPSDNRYETPVRLYHPAHQRYYLVAASLVCRIPGLPDKVVDVGSEERVSFVIRRVGEGESAYVEGRGWVSVQEDAKTVPFQEMRYPMFPLTYTNTEGESRRILAGFIPVASRETLEGAQRARSSQNPAMPERGRDAFTAVGSDGALADPRKVFFEARFIAGLREIHPLVQSESSKITESKAREVIVYALVELVEYLREYIPAVYAALLADSGEEPEGDEAAQALYDALEAVGGRENLRSLYDDAGNLQSPDRRMAVFSELLNGWDALNNALTALLNEDFLNQVEAALPDVQIAKFEAAAGHGLQTLLDEIDGLTLHAARQRYALALFDLMEYLEEEVGSVFDAFVEGSTDALNSHQRTLYDHISSAIPDIDQLLNEQDKVLLGESRWLWELHDKAAIRKSLEALGSEDLSALVINARDEGADEENENPPSELERKFIYVIRCVYERPRCHPYKPPVVSEISEYFELAPFFDADALVRPLRINMPDMSMENLRKMPRNVSIAISKELRNQMERVNGIKLEVLDSGDFPAEGNFNFGMICALSIPIITICALILLMIIVILLDLVFFWIPFFKICLPLPRGNKWTKAVSLGVASAFRRVSAAMDDWHGQRVRKNIRESIRVLLLTEPQERVMLPEFGAGLGAFLFEPNIPTTHRLIENQIQQALQRWIPRIGVESIDIYPGDAQSIQITISYRLIATGVRDTFGLRLQVGA